MSLEYSELSKYALDVQDGNGWTVLNPQPNDQKVMLPGEPILTLQGTQKIPMFWDVILTFQAVPKNLYETIARMYSPDRQKIRLNMRSVVNMLQPASTETGSGWISTDAIWRLPPIATVGQIRGVMVYDLMITLHKVEIDLLSNLIP
jgi:hypothetical protein